MDEARLDDSLSDLRGHQATVRYNLEQFDCFYKLLQRDQR